MMHIRTARPADLAAVAAIEAACFPAAEAADAPSLAARIALYPDSFLIAEEEGQVVGFINGAVIDRRTIEDEMFADAGCHRPEGPWQAVFGLDVLPARQHCGIAQALMRELIARARMAGRRGLTLTAKAALVSFYEQFGYRSEGVSASVHGGAVWYDMVLEF